LSLDSNDIRVDTFSMTSTATLQLHRATAADAAAVALLTRLDEAAPLQAPVLVAYGDGRPLAALSAADGRFAADPFARTQDVVALLRLHAAQARGSGASRRRRFGLGRRSARLVLG
jgi:hypothetical protein